MRSMLDARVPSRLCRKQLVVANLHNSYSMIMFWKLNRAAACTVAVCSWCTQSSLRYNNNTRCAQARDAFVGVCVCFLAYSRLRACAMNACVCLWHCVCCALLSSCYHIACAHHIKYMYAFLCIYKQICDMYCSIACSSRKHLGKVA